MFKKSFFIRNIEALADGIYIAFFKSFLRRFFVSVSVTISRYYRASLLNRLVKTIVHVYKTSAFNSITKGMSHEIITRRPSNQNKSGLFSFMDNIYYGFSKTELYYLYRTSFLHRLINHFWSVTD